jgi:lipopolysaccharide biosynthesis protein
MDEMAIDMTDGVHDMSRGEVPHGSASWTLYDKIRSFAQMKDMATDVGEAQQLQDQHSVLVRLNTYMIEKRGYPFKIMFRQAGDSMVE